MPQNINYNDELHAGTHTFAKKPIVPDESFGNPQIDSANPIDSLKLRHQYAPVLGQAHGVAASSERRVIHVARAAGSVAAIEAGVVVAAVGAATVTVDLRKNGTTILSAVITLNNSHAAYARVTGAIASAPYVAGDEFEFVLTATAGGGTLPQGVFATAVFREGAG